MPKKAESLEREHYEKKYVELRLVKEKEKKMIRDWMDDEVQKKLIYSKISSRHRLEDLGIIAEKLHSLLQSELFEFSNKHSFIDHYKSMGNEEDSEGTLAMIYRQISAIETELGEIHQIARWGDD